MSKTYFIVLGLSALVILGYFVFFFSGGMAERATEPALVNNDQYSIGFNYLAGADGYELIESNTQDDFLQSYVLVDKAELAEYRENQEDTAPPTISVFIFQMPDEETTEEGSGRITRLQNWAQTNAGITSFDNIYGTPEIVEIDGVKGLEYFTDGLYQQTIFLVSYRGYVYMFVGQFDRPTDLIKQDFEALMETVRFE
jgi:hypothetical protein